MNKEQEFKLSLGLPLLPKAIEALQKEGINQLYFPTAFITWPDLVLTVFNGCWPKHGNLLSRLLNEEEARVEMLPVFALGIKPIFPAKVEWSGSLDDAVAEALKIIRWSLDRHTWFSKFYFLPQDQLFSRVIPSGNPDEKRGLSHAIFHDKQKVWRGTLFFVRSKAKSDPPLPPEGERVCLLHNERW
jgi:hypothetical protein